MAPPESSLIEKIRETVTYLYNGENREQLTVKNVRNQVTNDLGLENGFFLQPEWKDKSKKIIMEYASVLAEREEAGEEIQVVAPEPAKKKRASAPKKASTPAKKRTQKPTAAEKSRPIKRQKKAATPSDEEPSSVTEPSDVPDEDSAESSFDSDVSDAPKSKRKAIRIPKAPASTQNKKRKQVVSDEEEDENEEDVSEDPLVEDDSKIEPTPKKKISPKKVLINKSKSKPKPEVEAFDDDGDDSSKLTTPFDSEETPPKRSKLKSATMADMDGGQPSSKKKGPKWKATSVKPEKSDNEEVSTKPVSVKAEEDVAEEKANASDSSDMSVVIDEGPKPKRKRQSKSKADPKERQTKEPKAKAKAKGPKAAAPFSASEEQIKTLQSHILRCGVRKIWAFELKQYGDDSSAKIQHLQTILKDIGMAGRFSEARAKEIKEMRELQADLEAVKEGEKSWGLESGRRSRSKASKKSMKVSSGDENDGKGAGRKIAKSATSGDSESEEEAPAVIRRRVKNDLAFLGDDDDDDESD